MVREWYWNRSVSKEEGEQPGCMRGMFHFFHFHHLLFTGGSRTPVTSTLPSKPELQYKQKPQQQPMHEYSRCKGLEAPRNSLDLQEYGTAIPEDYYGVPISIQIAPPPAMSKKKKESPAVTPRTRSIVARLMGLEVMEYEEFSSPSLTGEKPTSIATSPAPALGDESYKRKMKAKKKLQSLHECKSDTSAPRRPLRNLNSNFSGSFSLPDTPRVSSERPRDTEPRYSLQLDKENLEENARPGNQCLAREIMIKRSSHRRDGRFGYDGDESTPRSRRNKPAERKHVRMNGSMNQIQPSSTVSSPKAVLSEPVKKVQRHYHPSPSSLPATNAIKSRVKPLKMEPVKCSKSTYDKFPERITRQTQLTAPCKEQACRQVGILPTGEDQDHEFNYVKAILARADVTRKWFSLSLPIDPTIFHILELRQEAMARHGALQHRWNRKLMFHLVEEILGDLLCEPNRRHWRSNDSDQLLCQIWSQIRSLPRPAVCEAVRDIDCLVARNLPEAKFRRLLRHPSVVAEARLISAEIEWDILNSLLGEAAESLCLICSVEIEVGS